PHVAKLVKNSTKLVGIKAITADGTVLGIVEGYTFDPETGKISSLLLRGKTMKGILTLHISEVTTFGAQSIIVKPDSATRLTREAIPWSERLAQLTTEWTKKLREAFKH
ncbi:MAG: PRC-barrel domain-containing protein, partial [Clostridia bacterium]|nr:PRC-barrel domain-containing protein [Clostridia bacterium]